MEKVTVIVPVFNAGPYLKTCLESIVVQTYQDLEILLINDGSTDESASLCEAYRKIDSRVRLVHKKLGGSGVGAARNTALPLITGDYVLFVDNDDWLEPDHIERLYQSLKETDSDIAIANFTEFDEEKQVFRFHLTADDYFQKVYRPEEWFQMQYEGKSAFSQCFTVPWCKLYKAALFDNIVYPEDEKVEDDLTTWKVYLMADRIVYSHTSLYYHRKRSTSVTKTVDMAAVFPLKSIEERVTILSILGIDIGAELRAYRWRLNLHKESFLQAGKVQEYQKCLQKLQILEKWQK
ncbi:glycosyltransferase family 2 protein [Streptococcus acidominimus]|uniref:Glycosyltransferase family 2 protein n=1 Tax=Streptococcus acidominimus TaxID=1326 RepID=A0A4Y9FLI4_STRAI|nr:glycosyltransferase family 2 protein [Streptococcus acidominimus]MBF0819331.1 glycosyltransferase family 2 protein [Streptococcus acidominimus]MBF0839995.1 glycosyltransferase family 2 protein [Streptococcus acidominimus]MBF0847741.1 glycosyltransferase family 2 protein [Streptococcus danieliae]TFU30057.1 glycosyltransferase family 2 protein [Streptococcus acidominimus]